MSSRLASGNVLRVASGSVPSSIAGAIAGEVREFGSCELRAIGPAAVNQAVKAVAIARGYIAPSGIDLVIVPGFIDLEIGDEERTAIKFLVKGA